ncbi:hypothetical protein HDU97_008648 [Phlyctochytrium planicorne]|nr:hypothetical protein HDU97_008648 [Phlyctochytrium planicorne]
MSLPEPPAGLDSDVAGLQGRLRLHKDRNVKDKDASWMDKERLQLQAYEYLCHIGEAKEWIEACIKENIAATTALEEELRNGIILAKLAKSFSPGSVKKIFEVCLAELRSVLMKSNQDKTKLQYKHSDNINYLLNAMKEVGLPKVFFFELTDLYEKKNIPKVIYCIHALSHVLTSKGLAPAIKNLLGKLTFTDKELDATQQSLEQAGVQMPQFNNLENALKAELKEPSAEERRAAFLAENEAKIARCQNAARAFLARKKLAQLKSEKIGRLQKIQLAQSVVRMHQARSKYLDRLKYFKENENSVVKIQSTWKMHEQRRAYKKRLQEIRGIEPQLTKLQAHFRGRKVKKEYQNRLNFFKNNEAAIIKIQALWRAKHAQFAYQSLSNMKNPPLKTIQEFIDLLDDTEQDFEDEIDVEQLRRLVVRKIRENIQTEVQLNELDLKIALLVKNRISLEEVVHSTKKMKLTLSGESVAEKDHNPFSTKTMDKEARAKYEAYQQLFYLLQTQPTYLAKMMFTLNKKSGGSVIKFLEQVVLTLYGYAQNTREEYLLLSLIKTAIKIEVEEISKIDEFWRSNPFFIKLVLHYTRGAKERQFLRDLLQPLLKLTMSDSALDLETDPLFIYKSLIREEESRTGEQSTRPYDATAVQAALDPEVQQRQKKNSVKLRSITDQFLSAIIKSIKTMPFGIRYIAMQLKEIINEKFPGNDAETTKLVGNLIYYRYINPAIVAPEAFDVIEAAVSPAQRKNLAEVAKTLHQISVNRLNNSAADSFTVEMNEYISTSAKKFFQFFNEASNVVTAEEYFSMDEFLDVGRQQKPTILITPNEIYQVHDALLQNIDDLTSDPGDPLRQILNDLGAAPAVSEKSQTEVHLPLINRFAKVEDEKDSKQRHLFSETKRLVILTLRIQSGKNLLDVLEAPVTEKEESDFAKEAQKEITSYLLSKEKKEAKRLSAVDEIGSGSLDGLSSSTSLFFGSQSALTKSDGTTHTFSQIKRRTLENMAKLESLGLISKANNYQDMLNAIAKDMMNKHRRKTQRRRELESLKKTLNYLEEKSGYLDEQKKSYNDYVSACMAQLGNKKTKHKKAPMLFSRQYYHLKELNKTGSVPQYGSFKYTAQELQKKGVLISIEDYSPKQYNQITLTIASDEAGVFTVEASLLGVKLSEKMELRLEDLLQNQYDGVQTMMLFDIAKVNINLLVYMINKK